MRIDDVEFNADLQTILDELVTQLRLNNIPYLQKMKPTGNSIQVSCPYHADGMERRPSAGMRKSDGKFHCFACGEIHDLPEVISHCFGKDSVGTFGWQWLLKNFATIQTGGKRKVEVHINRGKKVNKETNYVTEEELDSYRYYHPYWKERGITDENIIELFDLGYDASTSCITFPVKDINGNCLFVARRSVKTKWFNYPSGVEKPLYGLYELTKEQNAYSNVNRKTYFKEIIVCESMLDALSFWQAGKYAVALNGVGSELQMKQLNELPCRRLILCTDMDKAGMKARNTIRDNVKNKIITEYILPEGRKDANECTMAELQHLQEVF